MQGLLLDVIQEAAPEAYAKRTKRLGIVNAWMDENFAQAVRDTGECFVKESLVAIVSQISATRYLLAIGSYHGKSVLEQNLVVRPRRIIC
jgi:hypothetical protein